MTPIGAAGSCGRLPDDRGDDAPACGSIAEFAQVDPLPRAQVDAPAADGKRESRPHERRFRMGGHVVVALVGVDVVGFAFADEAVTPNASRSVRTSGSAFSLRVRPAEVCLMKRCSNPAAGSGGRFASISSVIGWKPLLRGRRVNPIWRIIVVGCFCGV